MIQVFAPDVGEVELKGVEKVFESSWLGRGNLEKEFKQKLASFLKVDESQLCLSTSCTEFIFAFVKLFVPKDRVTLIPTISFPAIGSALLEFGVPFKLVDVDSSGCISKSLVEEFSEKENVGAVFLTHYGSSAIETAELREFLGDDVLILEDSACALGGTINGQAVGTDADFACWSFDAMKLITTGDGGLGFCKNPEHAQTLREYLYLGLAEKEKSGLDKSKDGVGWWEYSLGQPGRRSIMNDISAAMGLAQLDKIETFLDARRENIQFFSEQLKDIDDLKIVTPITPNTSGYYFTVATSRRDELALYLKNNGVYTTFRYWPLHKMEMFAGDEQFPVADEMASTYLNLPCHNKLSEEDKINIVTTVRRFYKAL